MTARIFEFPYIRRAYCDRAVSDADKVQKHAERTERLLSAARAEARRKEAQASEAQRKARQRERARFFDDGPQAA